MKLIGACILTDNVPRLVAFYSKVFECPANGDDIHSDFERQQLAIYNPGNITLSPHKNMSLMFYVDDVDATHARLAAIPDIRMDAAPTDKPWGCRSFVASDPDGNAFSLVQAQRR